MLKFFVPYNSSCLISHQTVFSLDIFKKDAAQSKWEYKSAIVSVSLITYLLAFVSIIAVDWEGFKRRYIPGWKPMDKLLALMPARWNYAILGLIFGGWELVKHTCLQWWKHASDGSTAAEERVVPQENIAEVSTAAEERAVPQVLTTEATPRYDWMYLQKGATLERAVPQELTTGVAPGYDWMCLQEGATLERIPASEGQTAAQGSTAGGSAGSTTGTQAGHTLAHSELEPKEAGSTAYEKDLEKGA
jgi:hypothetical protein